MYHIAIIEDNPLERTALTQYFKRYETDAALNFDLICYPTGDDFLLAHRVFDAVFMDIEMPGLDGMETATLWRSFCTDTPLIFVTNLASFALKGYEVDASGFLVKPVSYRDFCRCMDKLCRTLETKDVRSLLIPTKEGTHSVRLKHLMYIEVFNHSLDYHLTTLAEPLRTRGSLKQVEDELAGAPFVRISNSCLVNMDHIAQIKSDHLLMTNNQTLFFSRPKKRDAITRITNYLAGELL